MITIFNRKEVVTTYDVEKYANTRDDLRAVTAINKKDSF